VVHNVFPFITWLEKEDLESYKADLEEALEELKDMRADWKPEKEPNMDEEIELIKKWVKEREDFHQ